MGIKGLLKELRGVTEQRVHISKFKGKRVVVDASTWLYRGCYCCAKEISLGIHVRVDFLLFCVFGAIVHL